jgi:hypothetical protein
MRNIVGSPVSFLLLVCGTGAHASELVLYSGVSYSSGTERTYSWALEYRRALAERWSASFTWLNEGHIPGHHRDGHAAQLWWHADTGRAPAVRFGLGPYHYYDTRNASNSRGYADAHGWGLLASAEAIWDMTGNWFATARANHVQTRGAGNSIALLLGAGYRFAPGADRKGGEYPGPAAASDARRFEADALVGKAIVNSFNSETDTAAALGLRYRATRHISGSLSYMDEGEGRREPRKGVAAQMWLEDDVSRRISIGAGIGPYVAVDRARRADGTMPARVTAAVSVSGAYAINHALVARLSWTRVATRDDSDNDVVLLGLGYRF